MLGVALIIVVLHCFGVPKELLGLGQRASVAWQRWLVTTVQDLRGFDPDWWRGECASFATLLVCAVQ